jgi:hypothetical protein
MNHQIDIYGGAAYRLARSLLGLLVSVIKPEEDTRPDASQ